MRVTRYINCSLRLGCVDGHNLQLVSSQRQFFRISSKARLLLLLALKLLTWQQSKIKKTTDKANKTRLIEAS